MILLTSIAVERAGGDPSGWTVPNWTKDGDLEFMDGQNIGTSMLSLTAPGACILKGDEGAKLARSANEFCAQLKRENPARYGLLAALPCLLEKDRALAELAYAFDELEADGVTLFTRYGPDNHYLGHPDIEYIWKELDKRKAVVFIHPTHPVDTNLVNSKLLQPVIDYPFETTKTAVDMLSSNILKRYPNCKVVLSHAGGTLPYLVCRPASILPYLDSSLNTDQLMQQAKSFYFDTALSGNEYALSLLRKFAKPDHIIFGSDYPYAPTPVVDLNTKGLEATAEVSDILDQINYKNALSLFPRLQNYYN
ncbi:hypothetical protein TRICI_002232 [Trichomonascus ciferrii]|uniref:6-methylsalicylate decarboxylase n=1 Tax=Trichomonascus ciferrii TaxID=44093 RepID=A0A642V8N1_9ASCO|nr:hypothetical protein TRICI_002232 [Trichomonascus ciferrii]